MLCYVCMHACMCNVVHAFMCNILHAYMWIVVHVEYCDVIDYFVLCSIYSGTEIKFNIGGLNTDQM